MPLLGVTGGIATGKSAAMAALARLGAVALSADAAAREVTAPGAPALAEIAEAFGPEALLPDGSLNRAWVGTRVFADAEARRRLEAITHPRILRRLREEIDAARRNHPPGTVIAVEVPLLYEAGMESWFDRVLVVTAPREQQVARLMARNGLSREDALQRIAAQMPLERKVRLADDAIRNDGAPEELEARLRNLLDRLKPA